MRRKTASVLLLGLGWGGVAIGDPVDAVPIASTQQAPMSDDRWRQVTSRLESASVDIEDAAQTVAATAQEIGQAGRLSRLTQLSGLSTSLEHRVIQARLAAVQLNNP